MPAHKNYGIGTGGINLVDSPLHLHDVQLLRAQNAELSLNEAEQGLVKRPALLPLTTALGGTIFSLASIPIVDPGGSTPITGSLFFHTQFGTPQGWYEYADPWPDQSAVVSPPTYGPDPGRQQACVDNAVVYYLLWRNATANFHVYSFDGTTETELGVVDIYQIAIQYAKIATDGAGTVYLLTSGLEFASGDYVTALWVYSGGTFVKVGANIYTDAADLHVAQSLVVLAADNILVGTQVGGAASVISSYNGAVWATDKTFTADNPLSVPVHVASFGGDTYWALGEPNAGQGQVYQRSAGGVWTDVSPFATGSVVSLWVHDTTLFLMRVTDSGAFSGCEVWSTTDGTTWTQDYDLTGASTGYFIGVALNALYFVFVPGGIYEIGRRTSGGSYQIDGQDRTHGPSDLILAVP